MKRNWTKIALALGPAIMIASAAWEYASTDSDYNYLVQPWALRGYETVHGWIIVVAGALLLIGGLLTSMERSMKPRYSALIVGYIVIGATGFAAYFAKDPVTIDLNTTTNIMLSIVLAASVSLALRSLLGQTNRWFKRALLTFMPLFLAFFFLFGATITGSPVTLAPWTLVFLVFLVFGALSITVKPMDMGANRMLIIATVVGWTVILLSAGAIRQSLVDLQMETDQGGGLFGIAAQYKDTHAAGGWWLAGLGTSVMFVGAVGLWAKRRDIVAAIARAKRQRVAAETSAKEIADAAEAYAREHEGASAASDV